MSDNKTAAIADMTTEQIGMWFEGRNLWVGRSCGDCSDGPPCRCSSDPEELSPRQQRAVQFYRESAHV